ncbi:MAG: hypothetical protein AAF384_12930, partial [Pseudomonadota bacterium]
MKISTSRQALNLLLLTAFFVTFPNPVLSDEPSAQWDITIPQGEPRRLEFTATEGTWMSLSVSPDDQTIVFDLLGDIYTLPRSGGRAIALTQDRAWDIEPRFSPDGERIAFISDRDGTRNIWTMRLDGTERQQISKEKFEGLSSPTWTPDGQSIIARQKLSRHSPTYKGPWLLVQYALSDGAKSTIISDALNDAFQPGWLYRKIGFRAQVRGLGASGPSVSP